MDDTKKYYFKNLIAEHIKIVTTEIERLETLCGPVAPDNAIGRLSRMEAIGEKSIHEAAINEAKLRLEKLTIANNRVLTDDYGICLQCEEDIPEKRLNIIPESTHCVACMNNPDEN